MFLIEPRFKIKIVSELIFKLSNFLQFCILIFSNLNNLKNIMNSDIFLLPKTIISNYKQYQIIYSW